MMNTIRKLFDHLHWANGQLLEALQKEVRVDQGTIRLFAHILNAERVWLTRIEGKDSSQLPIWSDADLSACTELAARNEAGYLAFLNRLTAEALEQPISYRNSKGEPFVTRLDDILLHVALHGQYHRGQINSRLKAGGGEPVALDYILFVR